MLALLPQKYLIYAGAAVIFLTAIGGVYYAWKRDIERQALMEFNMNQLEQTAADQKKYLEKQELIGQAQQSITLELLEQNQKLTKKIESVSIYLNSDSAKKNDREASIILKNTIEQLQKMEMVP